MAVIPFLTANLSYHSFVSLPLSTGNLNCEICTTTRGALVGFVLGGLYPILLAIPVNGGLAARYESSPLPQRGNIFNYWITISKPVFRKMLFPTLLQTAFAAYLGSRQYKLLIKALQLPEPDLEIQWFEANMYKNKMLKIICLQYWKYTCRFFTRYNSDLQLKTTQNVEFQ